MYFKISLLFFKTNNENNRINNHILAASRVKGRTGYRKVREGG